MSAASRTGRANGLGLHWGPLALFVLIIPFGAGCGLGGGGVGRSWLHATDLHPQPGSTPATRVTLSGAGGEWLDFVALHQGEAVTLRVRPLQRIGGGAEPQALEARLYRVAEVQANTNHAGYLRLHGGGGGVTNLPRALVPLEGDAGTFHLPSQARSGEAKLWIDLAVPRGLDRGAWRTALEALSENGRVLATLPIELGSHGFDLPLERSLVVSAPLDWNRLVSLWPDRFRGTSPTLLSRSDPRCAGAVALLDDLIAQAQQNRVQLVVPALTGVVKWPAGRPPEADWTDYDALVLPWLTGAAFADGVGLRLWPTPRLSGIEHYSDEARAEYWQAALAHLDEAGVLDRCIVALDAHEAEALADPTRQASALSPELRMRLSQEAGRIARAHPAGRIALPLESDQVRFTGPENPDLFPPQQAHRLVIRADGLVSDHASRPWPAGLPQPGRYIDAVASPTSVPAPGSSESDVRLWGWLAFLRGATHLKLAEALPSPAEFPQSDPTRLTWFYPGDLFGIEGPVPTVQLKWLRRAQQDYEYLAAAAGQMEETYARVIARALVRPVRVEGEGQVDPVLPLIAGTPETSLWREGLNLVAGKVALSGADLRPRLEERFATDHTNATTAWLSPRERPVPIVARTRWDLTEADGKQRLMLRLGASVYNPSDASPEGMSIAFAEMPGGESPQEAVWQNPGTVALPSIATYEVAQAPLTTSASVDALALVFPTFQQGPLRLVVRNEFSGAVGSAGAVAPAVVVDERREPPLVDGQLGEWLGNEAIIDGRMVRMHSRPALQSGEVQRVEKPAQAFVGWTSQGLHVAFRLEDAARPTGRMHTTRNFVETEYRRVWGEDLCEILIQPVWTQRGDAVDGPLLHIICKPDSAFVRRRTDRRAAAVPWQNFESGMRFAATVDEAGVWRGEISLPWSALRDQITEEQLGDFGREARPALLRFNLSHHDGETGRSASWAGPVDFGADDQFTGALILRQPDAAP